MTGEEILAGGVANAGRVVRSGDVVHRPAAANQPTLDGFLTALRGTGFDGAPEPLGVDGDGRYTYRYIPGDVAIPPYPDWALSDRALASAARLLRRYHEAAASVPIPDGAWSAELADPNAGPLVAHNDVCPENVVFRDGEAIALLDFDFAAPGRRLWDVAATARMWGTIGDPLDGRSDGTAFAPERLYVFASAYGVDPGEREELYEALLARDRVGIAFVQSHVDKGEEAFIQMWEAAGGAAKRARNRTWLESNRDVLLRALAGD